MGTPKREERRDAQCCDNVIVFYIPCDISTYYGIALIKDNLTKYLTFVYVDCINMCVNSCNVIHL